MRVLAIRGANLASLDGEFEITLGEGPLADAAVYAICGPTGAGKSTLLDAMCLALFDTAPRLDGGRRVRIGRGEEAPDERLTTSDPRSLLRKGATAGYAEVDFEGADGRVHRARWEVRRANGRRNGKLQPTVMSLVDSEAARAALLGARQEAVERLVELDQQERARQKLERTADQLRDAVEAAREEDQLAQRAAASAERELDRAANTTKEHQRAIARLTEERDRLRESVRPALESFTDWESRPNDDVFFAELARAASEWHQHEAALAEATEAARACGPALERAAEQARGSERARLEVSTTEEEATRELDRRRAQRLAILEGVATDAIEQRLRQTVADKKSDRDSAQARHAAKSRALAEAEARLRAGVETARKIRADAAVASLALVDALAKKSLTLDVARERLAQDVKAIDLWRRDLAELDRRRGAQQAVLLERTRKRKEHAETEPPIDEGFGALDPSSLELVLGTLDALQASGRQVGVISHVPAIAERFETRVQVEPVGPARSHVRLVRGPLM